MPKVSRDNSIDTLLDLHGQILVVDEKGQYWVKFIVREVPVTPEKPHGLDYSLTLHDINGERLVGFDNAHAVKGGQGVKDHHHRLKTIKPYRYQDAASLLADFWTEVEKILKERGILP